MKSAGAWIDAIRLKSITQEWRDGRECFVRKRGASALALVRVANLFFERVENPVKVCVSHAEWQKWEVDCFKLLNGEEFLVFAEPPCSVVTERIPGDSIAFHFDHGTFCEEMLDSAAAELRRCHQLHCAAFDGAWSHGDANLTNFLIDPNSGRTRIIDFEVVHHPTLREEERHAEDLLVFLQDLCGCIENARWVPAATRFLNGYGRPEVIGRLKEKLVVPGGIQRLWWWIRCNYLGPVEMEKRMEALRKVI